MQTTAVMVDGDFFLRRHRQCYSEPADKQAKEQAKQVCDDLLEIAIAHASDDGGDKHGLYRIFFYDCAPLSKKVHNPISGSAFDFAATEKFSFRTALHHQLVRTRKVALRLGRLQDNYGHWNLKPDVVKELRKAKRLTRELEDSDFDYDVKQKGVDMRIGIDIASLAYKKQVRKIVLITGDADFLPAAKLARREGIDFVLDPMWNTPAEDLMAHIDGLKSHCPKPPKQIPGKPKT
jgi:uncharacterized LabA/DUF88 family protein